MFKKGLNIINLHGEHYSYAVHTTLLYCGNNEVVIENKNKKKIKNSIRKTTIESKTKMLKIRIKD